MAQNLGDAVSVSGISSDVYQNLNIGIQIPSYVSPNQLFTAYATPTGTQVPADQSTPIGNATLTDAYGFTAISPIPAGATVQSVGIQGGDTTTAGHATVTYCTAAGTGCTAQTTGNYTGTTYPYVELALPSSITVPGGNDISMPTIVLNLKATGAVGTVGHGTLTEFILSTVVNVPIIGTQTAVFDGYPTTGSSGTPPKAAPTALSTTTIVATAQTVSFTSTAPTGAVVGGATYTPTATASSGSPRPSPSTRPRASVCSISAGVVSFTGIGTCTLDGNQAGNATYGAAPQVQQSFTVTGTQTVSFTSTAPASATVGGATYTPTATATSGSPRSSPWTPRPRRCARSPPAWSATRRPAPAPSTATRPGTPTTPPPPRSSSPSPSPRPPRPSRSPPPPRPATVGGPTYTPAATATSGLTVAFTIDASSTAGACAIASGVVSFTGAGSCIIDANQAGNAGYNAAPQVQQTVTVSKASQTITPTSTAPTGAVVGGATYTPTATASSGLTVAITVDASSSAVCSISAGVVSFQTAGTCKVDFNQAGNGTYNAATQVQQSFTVGKGAQTITPTSTAPASASVGGPTYTPTATASSGLTVAITIDATSSSVCSITAGAVSYLASGTCTIDFNQAGNANYNAAPEVQQAIPVGLTPQTITITSTAPAATVGGPTYTITATGGASGNPVTFSIDASSTAGACSIAGAVVSFTGVGSCVIDANQAGNASYSAAPESSRR